MSGAGERAPAPVIVRAGWVYTTGRTVLRLYLGLYHRVKVEGREHLPRRGGVLIVANHQSFLDIPAVAVASDRHVAFVARETLARSRFLDFLMRHSGSVLVRRGAPDRAALEGMIEHLRQGDCVAVFPEGTRTKDGRLGVFRRGGVLAARRAGVPIVPLGICGAFEAWPRSRSLPVPRKVTIRFGAPIPADGDEALERAREAIAVLTGQTLADSARAEVGGPDGGH
jgi:1-acyl-sn-glycerol-3-phosphate acyltransferase